LYAGADHAAFNAASEYNSWIRGITVTLKFTAIRDLLLGFSPIVALSAAWWLDRRRQKAIDSLTILAAERTASPRFIGTLRASVSRPPGSLWRVYEFTRVRRAFNTARGAGLARDLGGLQAMVVGSRDRIDRFLMGRQGSTPASGWKLTSFILRLRQPSMILWVALLMPSFLWFVVGGWPATSSIQKTLSTGTVWIVVLVISCGTQVWLVWQVVAGLRLWNRAVQFPVGDVAAALGLRLMCAAGAVGFCGNALLRVLSGSGATSTMIAYHVAEAARGSSLGNAVSAAGGAAAGYPPEEPNAQTDSSPDAMSAGGTPPSIPDSESAEPWELVEEVEAHVAEHVAAEKIAEAVGIAETAAGFFAGFSLIFEGDTPGQIPKENVQEIPEVTVKGRPNDTTDDTVDVGDLPDAPEEGPVDVHDLPDAPVDVHDLPDVPIDVDDLPDANRHRPEKSPDDQ
jgi:hypothetical protein